MHRSFRFQVVVLAAILCLSLVIAPAIAEAQTPAQQQEQQAQQQQEQQQQEQQQEEAPPGYEETIVVTASRTEQLLLDAPTAITVINDAIIQNAAALNYADLLRSVPGLNVAQTSARDINLTSRAATNTLATSQLVLVDGRTVYQDFFGFVAWDLLPVSLDEIDRIEVIRGPGSAVWGANAMTGVVNVISKSPRDLGNIFSFRIGGGEQGTGYGSAIFSGVSDDWSYKVTGSYYAMDPWERPEYIDNTPIKGLYENTGTKQPKFDARVDRQLEGNQWLSFSGGYAGTSGIIHTGIGPFDIRDDTRFWYVRGDYNRGNFNTRFYANILDGYGPNLLNGIDFFFDTKTYDFSAQNTSVLADAQHILTYGGNFRFQNFDLSIAPLGDNRTEGGGFIEDSISAGEHFIFNLGARADGFSVLDGPVFSPRLAMLYRPIAGEDHVIRLSWNRAFRAPSLTNNYLFTVIPNQIDLANIIGAPFPMPFRFISTAIGNLDLVEERLDQVEIGLRSITLNNKVSLDFAFYWTRTKDNIDFYTSEYYSPSDPPMFPDPWPLPPALLALIPLPKEFSYRNIGQIDNLGFEIGVNARPIPRNEFMTNFSWQADPDVEGIPEVEVNKPPSAIFSIGWSGWYEDFLYSATVNYTGEAYWADVLDSRFHGWTEAYTTLNATFGYSFLDNTLDLMVRGTNLTNRNFQQHVFGDIIGRRVVVELAYGWNY